MMSKKNVTLICKYKRKKHMMKIEEGCQRNYILEDLKAGSYVTCLKYLEYHKSSCHEQDADGNVRDGSNG